MFIVKIRSCYDGIPDNVIVEFSERIINNIYLGVWCEDLYCNMIRLYKSIDKFDLNPDIFDGRPEEVDWCGVNYDGTVVFGRAYNIGYSWAADSYKGYESIGEPIKYSMYKPHTSLMRCKQTSKIQ